MDYNKEFEIAETVVSVIMGTAGEEESARLDAWINESEGNRELYRQLTQSKTILTALENRRSTDLDKAVGSILSRIAEDGNANRKPPGRRWLRAAVAACLVAAAGLSLYFTLHERTGEMQVAEGQPPSRVRILLADGKEIMMDDMQTAIETAGGSISRNEWGLVITSGEDAPADNNLQKADNKIITETGGEIHFKLSDGTGVWLNAESELSFPFEFGPGERRVTLRGEGYFEVEPDEHSPFIVVTDKMDVRVLGTTFNINAYADEPRIVTTLLSGRVRLSTAHEEVELAPGKAAGLERATDRVQVVEADTGLATAWMSGSFIFNDEGLDAVMRTLARWYGVGFSYNEQFDPQSHTFNGRIWKYDSLTETLDRITLAGGPTFRVAGTTIYIE